MTKFDFKLIEKKWREYWENNKTFVTDVYDFSRPKFYALDMFPYPSGQGLHIGHPEGYTATDIVARMKRMQGYNVLHPMGFDSFGLPAEQYAINTGNHPGDFTNKNIITFTKQLKALGFSFDWSKMISTCDPEYYRWTQWIFKQLYNDGLAENINMPVNWCEELGTVLANDEIIDGKSERGGFPVVRKNMKQWVLDIPKYAEKLLEGLNNIDWPASTVDAQRKWIGKSVGAYVDFKVHGTEHFFKVFTTRCDTLFGATYCVLAPEHELALTITTAEHLQEVREYIAKSAAKSELERQDNTREKTGVFTGALAINPTDNSLMPIYIADYVLANYGTGAIMAVPAHDTRDYEFAKKFGLSIIPVLEGGDISIAPYLEDGVHINSGFLNGMDKETAIKTMLNWLETNKVGKKTINYRLRKWIFARQRYWGEPIPIVHFADGTTEVLADDLLPVVLPTLQDYKPNKDGSSPLSKATEWKNIMVNNLPATRETSTMPGSAASSWYWLRYLDPHNDNAIADPLLIKHWLPVDLYVGGQEHAVGHLLYSRFWNNYLFDKNIVFTKEPFKKLVHQGMILGTNNEKMSKSRGNVINPDGIIEKFGSDSLRLFEMFMGPLESTKPWSEDGVFAAKKFLDRVWRLFDEENKLSTEQNENLKRIYNETVKKVTEDYESLSFNTAISQLMILLNEVGKENALPKEYAEGFVKMLNPIAPFITEEIWQKYLNKSTTITYEPWPTYDPLALLKDFADVPIQINGKLRGIITAPINASSEDIMKEIKNNAELYSQIDGKTIKKIIFVPQRIYNIVL